MHTLLRLLHHVFIISSNSGFGLLTYLEYQSLCVSSYSKISAMCFVFLTRFVVAFLNRAFDIVGPL